MASTETVPGGHMCTFGKSYSERRETQDEIKTNFLGGKGATKKHLFYSLLLNAYVTFRNNTCSFRSLLQ
jgi:hypothetical protein